MAHLQYMPGDPRLVDQLVYELKSKGIFDQFRKDCIADVDTRPAYQNLRQRVENSVATFLSRQCWKPDLNKNQLREKLRKHILDGNYLEQGVERIVDQVVNPKVATVFIPQVEDLVYNYLGITRQKAPENENAEDLLPTDLEAVSPGSVKSNEDKDVEMEQENMVVDEEQSKEPKVEEKIEVENESSDVQMTETIISEDSSMDKSNIPLPAEEIRLENIPAPENSPPKITEVELDSIALPREQNPSTDIPLPEETLIEKGQYFRPLNLHSDDSNSSSDSSLRRNMSPLTPIRNFNNENSCDAQQGFDDNSEMKTDDKTASNTFQFAIESKDAKSNESKTDKKETELSYQFNNQVNINYTTPMYDDSSNSNNLHIDYESDVNSKTNTEVKEENSQDKKEKKSEEKKSHKSSHRSRDSSRHSSSKDKRSDSKHTSSRHDKKSSKEDKHKSSRERERSKDRKGSRDSSKNSHKTSSSKDKDSKSHRSSSSSHRSKSDDKKSYSKDKERVSESSRSKDKSRDSKSKDKDRKSKDKDKKKDKKDIDDHYSLSGRGNHGRRSTDRDSNDGSSSSKGTHQNGSKTETKKDSKNSTKSDNTSISGASTSPSDKEIVLDNSKISQLKPTRVDNHLETPIANPPRLPFVPDVTLKKPKFAANLEEAKKLMKMRKFLDEEQKRMNQEAALLLEFQANVRPSLSQVYSSIPGPELEFACVGTAAQDTPFEPKNDQNIKAYDQSKKDDQSIIEENESVIKEEENVIKDESIIKEDDEKPIEIENVNEPKDIIPDTSENKEIAENALNNNEITQNEPTEKAVVENIEEIQIEKDSKSEMTYDENKPFSELMDEITEYSKASESKHKTEDKIDENIEEIGENNTESVKIDSEQEVDEKVINTDDETGMNEKIVKVDSENQLDESIANKYFEVTIITEELSESEDTKEIEQEIVEKEKIIKKEEINEKPEPEVIENKQNDESITKLPESEFQYFAEHEKYNAELKRHEYGTFLKNYIENVSKNKKIYLINCDTYEEGIVKEIAKTFGDFDVINYCKNGYVKISKNVVKDVTLSEEITLPTETFEENSPMFSPVKSDCSFELCSEYDTKLDDITKKSRQEVMEIILGSVIDASPSKMPEIDYYSDPTEVEIQETSSLKRSIDEVESTVNNNKVLSPNKIRRLSESDQITSTTEESEDPPNNNKVSTTRSKYLGRAKRVGLSRPKRCNLSNSPSSDKSVENYAQNSPMPTPNGKIKGTPRSKVQRYDTSDLYKPKLHYLSRRNNINS